MILGFHHVDGKDNAGDCHCASGLSNLLSRARLLFICGFENNVFKSVISSKKFLTDMPKDPSCRYFRVVAPPEYLIPVSRLLHEEGFRFEQEQFSPFCFRLLDEPFPLGLSLAAIFGYIYIQDRSSMLPAIALKPTPGSPVLDMAASPGSKSGFLAQLTGKNGFVLANEPNRTRLATLMANLQAMNLVWVGTCCQPGEKLPESGQGWPFVLLDPPCSGWGIVKKNPAAPKIWHGQKIQPLVQLQRILLRHAASLLAPGGKLLYSTCTTNPDENQAQTSWAISELGLAPVPLPCFSGITADGVGNLGLLINGEASRAQGFYLSLMQKPGLPSEQSIKMECDDGSASMTNLSSPVFDPAMLPPGRVGVYNGKAYFLPALSKAMCADNLKWRGFLLGKYSQGRFTPQNRLRLTLPNNGPRVVLESAADARRLLNGIEMRTEMHAPQAGLWLEDLPLGICQIKNGRITSGLRAMR